ncbi:MAG: hypothetical protein ACK4MT_09505, partial [Thermaurantiacus tibetensis]
MPATAYVNGRYLPLAHAGLPVEDRGTQFADAVYEVVAMFAGTPFDWAEHRWRLRRGLAAGAPCGRVRALAPSAVVHAARAAYAPAARRSPAGGRGA